MRAASHRSGWAALLCSAAIALTALPAEGAGTRALSGTVLAVPGGGLAGVDVTLSGETEVTVTTGATGTFRFTGVADGQYTLTARKDGYIFSPAARTVVVRARNVSGLKFYTFSIAGTLRAGGRRLGGVTVSVSGAVTRSTVTDSDGNFRFAGLGDGDYAVSPRSPEFGFTPLERNLTIRGRAPASQNFVGRRCLMPDADGDGDSADDIQRVLNGGGHANLCENQVFLLSSNQCPGPSALCYKKPGQRVYTNNFPDAETGTSTAAVLVINGDDVRSIIYGELSGTLLRSVVLDGNRRTFGQHPANAWATVEIGAAVGQRVEHVLIRDTRTWSSLHIFEGRLTCTGAVVANVRVEDAGCDIHGNGCERDDRVGTWADGISYSCRNGVVRDNVVENATDGGIVLFAPAGTDVFNNTVTAVDRVMLGGINMVDDGPFRITINGTVYGDFSGVKVHHNTIAALGSRIDVGIGQGPRIWFCDDRHVNYGASVTDNLFTGAYMGWGAAIDGVRNWTFDGNTFAATHGGPSLQGCGDLPVPAPTDCRRHPEHVTGAGVFQAECAAVAPGHALHGILLSNQIR